MRSGKPVIVTPWAFREGICHPCPGGWGLGAGTCVHRRCPPFTSQEGKLRVSDVPTPQQQRQEAQRWGARRSAWCCPHPGVVPGSGKWQWWWTSQRPPHCARHTLQLASPVPIPSLLPQSSQPFSEASTRVTLMPSARKAQGLPLSCVSEGPLGAPGQR